MLSIAGQHTFAFFVDLSTLYLYELSNAVSQHHKLLYLFSVTPEEL